MVVRIVELETTMASHEASLRRLNASSVPASEINELSLKRVLEEQHVMIYPARGSPSWENLFKLPIPQPLLFEW